MPYLDSLDIGNRALQHCGLSPILTVNEDSQRNTETANAYDKVRRAELRRNVWRFSIRKAVLRPVDTTTMILAPALWNIATLYLPGAIVSDSNSLLWMSNTEENTGNSPGDTGVWDRYFGPLTVGLYDSTQSYFAGELVYKAGTINGSYGVFLSLQSANSDVPDTVTAYDATVTYTTDQVVSYSTSLWRSLIPYNVGNTPADGPTSFDVGATYSSGQQVTGSDHFIYTSATNGNIGHDPTTDGGVHWTATNIPNAWSRSPTMPTASIKWRSVNATISSLQFTYPIGSGPSSQTATRNVFRLPAGFIREAPQDPKAGSTSALGAPSGLIYSDWNFEGNYIVSPCTSPIMLRFAADVSDVQAMDDMFCEGLACRVAASVCETLTQSTSKIQTIASEYKLFMGEARTINAIEVGPIEPAQDDFLSCRY